MPSTLTRLALLAMTLYAAGARADDPDAPMFSLNGYGTLGLVHSSENNADYTASVFRPNGAGHTRSWSAGVDSRIGAQATAKFTPRISAVLQVISEQRYDNSYTPSVEWANVKYQVTPDFSIRAGRIVLPTFLLSDSRKVGYSQPWARLPDELYSLVPVSYTDGVDAGYRVQAGEFTNTVRGTYGQSESKLPAGGTAKAKGTWSLSSTAEYGAATARISYVKTRLSLPPPFIFDGIRQFGAEGIALADKYDADNKPLSVIGLGATYDPGRWFVTGEWGTTHSHSALGDRTAWYASGGYRFGKFTPYLLYARTKADSNTSDPGLNLTGLPPLLAVRAAGLNAGLNAVLGAVPVQKTLSVGGRWDFVKDAALKLQLDHTRLGAGSAGTLANIQPGFQPGGKVTVFSATLDFVF